MIWTLLSLACGAKKSTLPTQEIQVAELEIEVEIADDPAERHQGLMYRQKLDKDAGMLFVYPEASPRSFWMENTSIPLSIAFMDETGRVLNIEDMTPYDRSSVPSAGPAMYALEMNQGWFKAHQVGVGSVVVGLPGPSES
ncbi:MAG: DUF192 domain-containing protein [Myxococcota bacterium]|nr:DUF192 domain-containing protein [Myxococcota bacterium]